MISSTTCRSCRAEVWLLRHERTGRVAPIEVAANRAGNILVDLDKGTYSLYNGIKAPELVLHFSHFVRCPDAAGWRS